MFRRPRARRSPLPAYAKDRIEVIPNAIRSERFLVPDPEYRRKLIELLPVAVRSEVKIVVGAAGRLSPEKGFDLLIKAASDVVQLRKDIAFVLFGEGPLRDALSDQVRRLDLGHRFFLAGFCDELDRYLPHLDLFVQSSHTEGLPNVLLEAPLREFPWSPPTLVARANCSTKVSMEH